MKSQSFCRALACAFVLLTSPGWLQAAPQSDSLLASDDDTFSPSQIEFFENEVRPILVEYCFECHGPDSSPIEGGLLADSRDALLEGGDTGPAMVPGDADQSLLVDAINYGDVYEMPPDTKLADEDIRTLTQWIEDGAAWPGDSKTSNRKKEAFDIQALKANHWVWKPVRNVAIPNVADPAWPRGAIDHFILKKIEDAGLSPAEPASRSTLIRRTYFDLIGLPPSPQQISDFVHDESDDAFETVVDELLASPRFGERWARHWMDLTRYAESYGHQYDYNMAHAYRYRDYLIRAFNEDISYRQLIHEHIAGDLLKTPRRNGQDDFNESIIGTGFWFLGERKPSAVDSRGSEAEAIDNQIDVMCKSFLGLTVGCARCHDHKFDAISTADYYSLAGFLQSSRRQIAMLDPGHKIESAVDVAAKLVQNGDGYARRLSGAVKGGRSVQAARYLDGAIDYLRTHPVVLPSKQGRKSSNGKQAKDSGKLATTNSVTDLKAAEKTFQRIANERELDIAVLKRVVGSLSKPTVRHPSHPLHLVWLAAISKSSVDHVFADRIAAKAKSEMRQQEAWLKDSVLFADFSNGLPDDWFRTGFAFDDQPATSGVNFSSSGGVLTPAGTIHSGRFGKEFYGVVRSPTFRLDHKHINYLVKGENATIRIIIDGFFMDEFRDLLFAGARFKIAPSEEFVWQVQGRDVSNHVGSTAHIELIDHGKGYIAVDEIRFSGPSRPVNLACFSTDRFLDADQFDTQSKLCERVAVGLRESLADSASAAFGSTASWVIEHDLDGLFFPVAKGSKTGETHTTWSELASGIRSMRRQVNRSTASTPSPMLTIGITDGTGEDEQVFIRGNHKTLGDVTPRRFLSAVSDQPLNPAEGSGRLLLARKITAPNNPLTTRVAVNRIWHHLFGRGIVETVDNFGALGKRPTHPQLLDYLASEFASEGWSIKQMIRKIVLSQTYQMASTPNPEAVTIDPDNHLLHRSRIRRLQGEAIRDAMLAVSGQIDYEMYGPSVPIHLTSFMTGRGRPRKNGPLDGAGRRTVYVAVRRNFLSPMMLAFDSPLPANTSGRRTLSNVPAQALILMNSPFVLQQAQRWADRLIAKGATAGERVEAIYLAALGRLPSDAERIDALAFLALQSDELGVAEQGSLQNRELWRDFCHVIFNVKEFIYIN